MFSLYRFAMPLIYPSIRAALSSFIFSLTCPYTSSVKAAVACPRLPCTVFTSSPFWRERTANVCPYGIIRTNRKTLALQRVGWFVLILFPSNSPQKVGITRVAKK